MGIGGILLLVVIGLAIYAISIYNSLQTLKTQIVASIQEIGNQLKRQASLIPNLEASVKGYMGHEKGIFKMLTDARTFATKANSSGKASDINDAIDKIQSLIPAINVMVESNPEIKADATVTKFMDELTDTADKLMYARRSLIDLSQAYNQKLVVFPGNIIAGMFGFKPEQGLGTALTGEHTTVSADEMKDVKVSL
jgi:LemA protein